MPSETENVRSALASLIHAVNFHDFPPEAVHHAKLCLLDLLGVSIAGSLQSTSVMVRELLAADGGRETATVWGYDRKMPLLAAAFINAVQGHAIDMDDGHRFANGHPGVVTIPAAIALAEQEGASGCDLLEAVVAGYEVFIRLGVAANPDLLLRGFHTTAVIGPFAAAAVTARLLKLSRSETENALSLAGLQSAGLLEALGSGEMGKSLQVGKASQAGVLSGLLARQGADGPERIFEGEKGFFSALAGKPIDPQAFATRAGGEWQITGAYFKKHAACRHIHSALDAVTALAEEHRISPEAIDGVDIETYSIAHRLTGQLTTQESELAAKFSMPVAVALQLVFGRSDASIYKKQYVSDARVRALAEKVRISVNTERDKVYPGLRGAGVTVRTAGRAYEREVLYSKGEPENPLGDDELFQKFENNACTLYSSKRAGEIKDLVLKLEDVTARDLTRLLAAPSV